MVAKTLCTAVSNLGQVGHLSEVFSQELTALDEVGAIEFLIDLAR